MSNPRNPQEPPTSIDVGHLTETVTSAVQRALAGKADALIHNPRITIGIIMEPQVLQQLEAPGKQSS